MVGLIDDFRMFSHVLSNVERHRVFSGGAYNDTTVTLLALPPEPRTCMFYVLMIFIYFFIFQ